MGSSAVGAAASRTVAYSSAAAVALAIAAAVRFSGAATGSHGVSSWGPLGVVVIAAAAIAACSGRGVAGRTAGAAALFAAVGAWAVASTEWGGIRSVAWTTLDQFVIAGAALVLGALLAGGPRGRTAVLAGVVAGQAVLAAEILVRLGVDAYPGAWWSHRFLVGPAGYKNAQASLAALAVPLALWFASASRPAVRAAGAAAAALLLSTMLLTQSRAALAGVVIATAAQVALVRRRRVAVAAGALVAAGLVLAYPLTRVDAAALTGSRGELGGALRDYVAVTGAAAVLGALAVLVRGRFPRRGLAGVAVLLAVGILVTGAAHGDRVDAAVSQAPGAGSSDGNASLRAPGDTALTGLTSNGRWDAWRVAWRMIEHDPLRGHGVGSFSVTWLADPHQTLHLLQPHSIELELWAELGLVGLVLFGGGCALAAAALRRAPDRAAATAAGLALLTLLVQSSVDWTWSFPGAVVPALLVVGAAVGSSRAKLSMSARLSIALVAALFLVSVGAPYLADRKRRQAEALAAVSPAAASDRARTAHSIDPLNPEVMFLQGQLAEVLGSYTEAAQSYAAAARESREQWLGFGNAARAWKRAGNRAAALDACRNAIRAGPNEERDLRRICSGAGGRSWPVERLPHTSLDGYRAAGCSACSVRVSGDRTQALVGGWADFESAAYRSLPVAGAGGGAGMLLVADRVSLPVEPVAGDLALLEVRDGSDALLFSILTRGPSGVIALYTPAGGVNGESLVLPTRRRLVPGGRPVCLQVAYLRDRLLRVAVDGVGQIAMPGPGLATPSGAKTGRPARLLVGILGYDGTPVDGPLRAVHAGAGARLVASDAVPPLSGCG